VAIRKTTTMDTQEEMVRLLAIQIRRTAKSQNEAILEMGKAGFGPARIATLLGTTADTVSQAMKAAKRAKKSKTSDSR
jgi:DNA-directed RNA polymerase specialized sigma24 family protein